MRKWIIAVVVLLVLAISNPVFAGQQRRTIVDEEILTYADTRTTGTINVVGAKKVAFFVTYDSSLETTGVTATVTFSYTFDGTNWTDMKYFDVAGGATYQSSETLSTDTLYYTWLDYAQTAKEVRVYIGMGDTSITSRDGTATITVEAITQD